MRSSHDETKQDLARPPTHRPGNADVMRGLLERVSLSTERKRKGKRELSRLRRSDAVLFSPGNSGRTWLRVMITRVIEQCYDLPEPALIGFDNLKKRDPRVPAITVTHNRWLPFFLKPVPGRECAAYYDSRVLLLVRNPLDTCVSQYYQWKHRSKDDNVRLKGWPARSTGLDLVDFMQGDLTGVARLCDELNTWLRESGKFSDALILRYEDLLQYPLEGLTQALQFLRIPASEPLVQEAVDYGSFGSMKQRESETSPGEASASSPAAENARKARVGKVSGYRNYLEPEQAMAFESLVTSRLASEFGYGQLPQIVKASLEQSRRA